MNIKIKNNGRFLIKIGIILPFFVLFLLSLELNFQVSKISHAATNNIDTIAIQIIPNPKHYSPREWCKRQGYGNNIKESNKIDGYESVRIGRTTYVGVSNIAGNNLKTYIYLISYSQNADADTKKIYNRLLKHWHFNTNIATLGECSISNMYCQEDSDCKSNEYECIADPSGQDKRKFCQLKESKNCLIDKDCPDGIFCDSVKAKVIRDTKRFSDIRYAQDAMTNYFNTYKKYPSLKAGTYIASTSISTWNSWDNEFSSLLGVKLPSDPLNIMGECITTTGCAGGGLNFDPHTCWDKSKKWFADADCALPLNLPSGSYAYFWHNNNFCVKTESGYTIPTNIPICQ